eukprot:GHVN01019791.1.p1 GENE.GHVN01019791.1~~GHVN01019791.1.p1  ORF type:complete len:145 (+),score=25.76 GHVN01019791.1:1-435(+)
MIPSLVQYKPPGLDDVKVLGHSKKLLHEFAFPSTSSYPFVSHGFDEAHFFPSDASECGGFGGDGYLGVMNTIKASCSGSQLVSRAFPTPESRMLQTEEGELPDRALLIESDDDVDAAIVSNGKTIHDVVVVNNGCCYNVYKGIK